MEDLDSVQLHNALVSHLWRREKCLTDVIIGQTYVVKQIKIGMTLDKLTCGLRLLVVGFNDTWRGAVHSYGDNNPQSATGHIELSSVGGGSDSRLFHFKSLLVLCRQKSTQTSF